MRNKRIAIITGASSGMGRQFSMRLSDFKSVDELWLIARRKDVLEEVREEINKPCIIIDEDVKTDVFEQRFREQLKKEKPQICFLVNCAGFGIIGSMEDSTYSNSVGMVQTNCLGLTAIIKLSLPYITKNGRIINIASSAAFLPQPDFAIYAATKSYVLSLSRALNVELHNKGISVTAVCPGPVDTAFFNTAEQGKKRAWYKEFFMANCDDVVNKAIKDAIARKDISIYGTSMKLFYIISKIIPTRFLLTITRIISK